MFTGLWRLTQWQTFLTELIGHNTQKSTGEFIYIYIMQIGVIPHTLLPLDRECSRYILYPAIWTGFIF